MKFDGESYDPDRDGKRLESQFQRVFDLTSDGQWHRLADIVACCGGTEASVSARLRDMRKERFGAYTVERRYVDRGVWEYRRV